MAYATLAQLATFLGVPQSELPATAQRSLDNASELVDYVTLNRLQVPEPTTEPQFLNAARQAVLYQYEYWTEVGEQVDSSSLPVQSFTVGSFTMTYDSSSGTKLPLILAPRARRVLLLAGLYYRGVNMR